jgi:hypothetical protein
MPIVPSLAADGSTSEWQKTYGGPGNDMTWSMTKTTDGGYVMAGETQTDASALYYAWLIKTDANGNALWNKTYDGTFRSVIQTSEGGLAIAGIQGYRTTPDNDFLLVKTDAQGNVQWRRTFDPFNLPGDPNPSSTHEWAWGIDQTADGGYVLTGSTNAYGMDDDVWIVKTDASGNMQWNRTFGGPDVDYAYVVVQTSDGGYAIGGGTEIPGRQMDFWLIKTDSNGRALWNRTYGKTETDWLYSMIQTSDGGFALVGGYGLGAWLVKTNALGNEQWNKTYSGNFRSVAQTTDGGYAMAGDIDRGNYVYDFWFVKADVNGDELWNRTLGGVGMDQAFAVVQPADGSYILSGPTESYGAGLRDLWLVKITGAVVPEFQSNFLLIASVVIVAFAIVLGKAHAK